MQRYTEQLIEDILNAKKRPLPPKMELPPELELMRGAEEYLHGALYKMGDLFGLDKVQFPSVEKLDEQQTANIVKSLIELWEAFNFVPDFPDGLPAVNKYKLLIDYLEHETTVVSNGHNHLEFCTYDPDSCPFPEEFCMCKDFEFDDEDLDMSNMKQDGDTLPF